MFFETFINTGILKAGDYLILDNAAIHLAQEFRSCCQTHQIFLKTLPTYSPELNPCERVFAMIKNWLRTNRSEGSFEDDLLKALENVKFENVRSFYMHCTDPDKIKGY